MEDKIQTREEIVKEYRQARKDLKHYKRLSELRTFEVGLLREVIRNVVNHKMDMYEDWCDAYADVKITAECRLISIDRCLSKDSKWQSAK